LSVHTQLQVYCKTKIGYFTHTVVAEGL